MRMTPRQRVLAVLNGEKPDKVPFTIYETKLPQCSVERELRNAGLCIVNRMIPPVHIETPNCPRRTLSYSEAGKPLQHEIIQTSAGELTILRQPTGYTSWTLEHCFKGPEDYAKLRALVKDEVYKSAYDSFRLTEQRFGEDVILRAAVGSTPLHMIMVGWMGVETFATEWAERRDEILALEKLIREKRREIYPLLAAAPITHANYGGNEVPEVMGPPRFREFCLPLYAECAEHFKRNGKLLGAHLDGNNRAWAQDVANSALDYVEAFSPAPDTDLSLEEALQMWPDKILWINFPSSLHVQSVAAIKKAAEEFVILARETNRVIIGITEDIPEDRWQQNLLAISEVIDNY